MGTISSAASRIRKGVVPALTSDTGTDRSIRISDDGLLYWKTPGGLWVRANGLIWTSYGVRVSPSGDVNGGNDTFVLPVSIALGSEMVYLNGVLMVPGVDYTITGLTIVFTVPPMIGATIRVNYFNADYDMTYMVRHEFPAGTVGSGNTTFTLAYAPIVSSLALFLNTFAQMEPDDYTLTGNTIVFNVAPPALSDIRAYYVRPGGDAYNFVVNELLTPTPTGSNQLFYLANTPIANTEQIILNGILQDPTTDYFISGNAITFVITPVIGSSVRASYFI